jgi:hypothetical protein
MLNVRRKPRLAFRTLAVSIRQPLTPTHLGDFANDLNRPALMQVHTQIRTSVGICESYDCVGASGLDISDAS